MVVNYNKEILEALKTMKEEKEEELRGIVSKIDDRRKEIGKAGAIQYIYELKMRRDTEKYKSEYSECCEEYSDLIDKFIKDRKELDKEKEVINNDINDIETLIIKTSQYLKNS
jgi:predicted transcriptional regulator